MDKQSSADELTRQVRQHVESLQAAGVEWLPHGPPLPNVPDLAALGFAAEPAPQAEAAPAPPAPVSAGALFDEAPPMAAPALTPDQRRHELTVLAQTVSRCTRCATLAATRTQTVFGVGPIDAELCFIGEAPGFDEDKKGEPFVGAAGQLLNRIIAACGMKRDEVFICNILRCRPPQNRLPLPDEAAHCREYLERTLELVRPRFLCALGACAAQNLLQTTTPIGKLRGRFHDYRGIPVMCTFHPAFLLRTPERKKDVWEDMKQLLERMGRPVPGK